MAVLFEQFWEAESTKSNVGLLGCFGGMVVPLIWQWHHWHCGCAMALQWLMVVLGLHPSYEQCGTSRTVGNLQNCRNLHG